jgi:hypothetical protein
MVFDDSDSDDDDIDRRKTFSPQTPTSMTTMVTRGAARRMALRGEVPQPEKKNKKKKRRRTGNTSTNPQPAVTAPKAFAPSGRSGISTAQTRGCAA